ncbi:MAG: hypothetical protein AB7O38_13485 [Pirellulaceae bacterium]
MRPNEELEQKLWELAYGLLDEGEAASLRAQIARDTEVAAYERFVREQVAVVTEAALWRIPQVRLTTGESSAGSSVAAPAAFPEAPAVPATRAPDEPLPTPVHPTASHPAAFHPIGARAATRGATRAGGIPARARWGATWGLAVAASLLVGFLGYAWHSVGSRVGAVPLADQTPAARSRLAMGRESPAAQIVVVGPSQVVPGMGNWYSVATYDAEGQAQAVPLIVTARSDSSAVLWEKEVATDAAGRGAFAVDPQTTQLAALDVAAYRDAASAVRIPLSAAAPTYDCYVAVERPWYQLGEVVRYRSVVLSRANWEADREASVMYEITDPQGQAVPGSNRPAVSEDGVAVGEFALDGDLPSGDYTVVARSPDGLFPVAERQFYVHAQSAQRWNIEVAWEREGYRGGESAEARLRVRDSTGSPAGRLPLVGQAFLDGRPLPIPEARVATDAAGEASLQVSLPASLGFGEGRLTITPEAPGAAAFDTPIPLQPENVVIDCYPEGGPLVVGLENRVYFHCHDILGRPVTASGEVVAPSGGVVATFVTRHAGRGSFRLVPAEAQAYTLRITEPPGVSTHSMLSPQDAGEAVSPAGETVAAVAMDCGAGVFARDDPVGLALRSANPGGELTITANCRGALVGHARVTPADFQDGTCRLVLPIDAQATGVLRVTVFRGPDPVAERVVFRTPRRLKLNVDVADSYRGGERAKVSLTATDEQGAPLPALLGVRVVDEAIWKLARPAVPALTTHFWMWNELQSPEKLEDANFYVGEDSGSREALDLLLGTQGWRRIREGDRFGLAQRGSRDGDSALSGLAVRAVDSSGGMLGGVLVRELVDVEAERPVQFDNLAQIQQRLSGSLEERITESDSVSPRVGEEVLVRAGHRVVLGWGLVVASVMVLLVALWVGLPRGKANRPVAVVSALVALVGIGMGIYWSSAPVWELATRAVPGSADKYTGSAAAPAVSAASEEAMTLRRTTSPQSASDEAQPGLDSGAAGKWENELERRPAGYIRPDEKEQAGTGGFGRAASRRESQDAPSVSEGTADRLGEKADIKAEAVNGSPPAPSTTSDAVRLNRRAQDLREVAPAPSAREMGIARPAETRPPESSPAPASAEPPAAAKPVPSADRGTSAGGPVVARPFRADGFAPPRGAAPPPAPAFSPETPPASVSASQKKDSALPGAVPAREAQVEKRAATSPLADPAAAVPELAEAPAPLTRQALAIPPIQDKDQQQARYFREWWRGRSLSPRPDAAADGASLYWNPMLLLDASGRTELEFNLPARTSATYRLQVDGHRQGQLGDVSAEIHVSGSAR